VREEHLLDGRAGRQRVELNPDIKVLFTTGYTREAAQGGRLLPEKNTLVDQTLFVPGARPCAAGITRRDGTLE
jgi:hypothetical protein